MKQLGFVDLQVNGFKGIGFSDPDLTIDKVRTVTNELAKAGTIAYCPTIATGPIAIYRRNLPILAQAAQDKELSSHILGLHIEGPFISPTEGARGAHPLEHITGPSIDMFTELQQLASGHIIILTLAPETDGAFPLISFASENGVVVSLGHHFADDAVLSKAVESGAKACTHLGNGVPDMINRHQNPIWWQLACDKLHGMFITDGNHLPADFIQVALRAKTVEKFIVVSDMTAVAGLPPGTYGFHGSRVKLAPSGRISFENTPYLAGSSATMLQCMNYLASLHVLNESELWKVGFDNPLALLGKDPHSFHKHAGAVVEMHKDRFVVS